MQTREKAKFKCPHCKLGTVTTNTRYFDTKIIRRHKCDQCETMYVVLYVEEKEPEIINSYKPREHYGYIAKKVKGD